MSKKQALTNDELLAQFDELNVEDAGAKSTGHTQEKSEQDLLDELQNLASQRPASRPASPRVSTNSTRSPNRISTATPPGRSSEEKSSSRKSGDISRPYHTSMTPAETTSDEAESTPSSEVPSKSDGGGGGGWWGGIFATASAAVKQAEAAVKEIQNNEEAQRWAEQVKGNVGALKGLGT